MRSLVNIIRQTTTDNTQKTRSTWPVWKQSTTAEISFSPLSKTKASKIWHAARRWDQRTRQPSQHGGIIGRTAMSVLYSLLWDFLNHKTGRLDPSIAAISKKAGVCERTAHKALTRLKSLGILNWLRRCRHDYDSNGRFLLRQDTNAYAISDGAAWTHYLGDDPPQPTQSALGSPDPISTPLALASSSLAAGHPAGAHSALTSDPRDALALALAGLGRLMGAI